jgi:hypothetical protein
MSSYNVKNYTENGGEVTHIGGKLVFDEGATVEGFPDSGRGSGYELPIASAATLGGVKVGDGLSITDGVLSADPYTMPEATVETRGAVKSAESQDEINTTDLTVLVRAFNGLVEKLKNAGLMASSIAPAGA